MVGTTPHWGSTSGTRSIRSSTCSSSGDSKSQREETETQRVPRVCRRGLFIITIISCMVVVVVVVASNSDSFSRCARYILFTPIRPLRCSITCLYWPYFCLHRSRCQEAQAEWKHNRQDPSRPIHQDEEETPCQPRRPPCFENPSLAYRYFLLGGGYSLFGCGHSLLGCSYSLLGCG